jgi:hypothetical protein
MLLLFTLSITPRQWLHDAITGHKHSYAGFGKETGFQTSKANFQCNWDHQLVESPFTMQPDFQLTHPAISHSARITFYTLSEYSAQLTHSSLRGPPPQA